MFSSFQRCAGLGALPLVHAENGDVVAQLQAKLLAEGNNGPEAHAYSRPAEVEGEATNRAIMIADMAGSPVYIVHTSCEQAHEAIRRARAKGMRVFGEPLIQHLTLDETEYFNKDWDHAARRDFLFFLFGHALGLLLHHLLDAPARGARGFIDCGCIRVLRNLCAQLTDGRFHFLARLQEQVTRLLARSPLGVFFAPPDLLLALFQLLAQRIRFRARGLGSAERLRHRAILVFQLLQQLRSFAF